MPLIRLLEDPEDDTIPPPPPMVRGAEFPIEDLLLEFRAERRRAKRREAAYLSALGHLALLALLLLSPKIFQPVRIPLSPSQAEQKPQLTYLELPPELITRKKTTQPKALSNRNRHFDHPTKITDSLSVPVPRPAPKPTPATPPPGPLAPKAAAAPPQPVTKATPPPAAAAPKPKPAPDSGLKLEDIPQPAPPKLNLHISAADQLRQAIEQAARDGARGSHTVSESAPLPRPTTGGSGASAPGQTGAGVQILTDTQGVDFDPYLRRIVEIVRRNWYAVMPETVYLGTQGRVVIIFNINSNGTVPGIHPVGLSGTASLDQAAEASISASNPFPPLPSQFHGPFITLQFSFYYNLTPPN
ncbi:MAG: energy transducer TonB [Terriglobales bacterium]